jgi:hypothetical protein
LHLDRWPWLVGNLRDDRLLYDVLLDGREIAIISTTTIWPKTRPKLEKNINAVYDLLAGLL